MPAGGGRFNTTRWSVVLAVADGDSPPAAEALAKLCETYWFPLFAHLRSKGYDTDDAEDLTQAFIAYLLEKKVFRHADPARGRFRSFLLKSLQNFAANERDRELAKKRAPATPLLRLDAAAAEVRYQLEPATGETPERIFDRRWALALLDCVMIRLAADNSGARRRAFDLLKVYLTGEQPHASYADTAAALRMTEGAVKTAVHRLRKRFREIVKEEVGHTVASPEEVESEIRHLLSAVSAHGPLV
jgi:DNA-directed RNA polymerase specialized sigma24 family protein